MKIALFDKDASITSNPVFFAYRMLQLFNKNRTDQLSIFKLLTTLKDTYPSSDPKQFFYGLVFLYSAGIIEMDGAIVRVKRNA
jgi:hypothetical protein